MIISQSVEKNQNTQINFHTYSDFIQRDENFSDQNLL